MNNAQVFRAIGLDDEISSTSKYTLMIIVHVCMSWADKSYRGKISADQIAKASAQSSRQVQRHLKQLVDAGWLSRSAEKRGPGLHHKSLTILNQGKVREILDRPRDTTDLVKPDTTDLVSHDTTYLVKPDTTELVSAKSDVVTTTDLVSHDTTELVTERPKVSYISNTINNNIQSIINREVKPEPEVREAAETWDNAFSKHELEEITEECRDGLWYVSRVDDMLEYRKEVHRQCTHHNRRDVRDALLLAGGLLPQMARELIAPRSAIDWCTLQAAGELPSVPTPAAPPKPSNVITVTVEDQQRMKEVDHAWSVGSYDMKGNDEW